MHLIVHGTKGGGGKVFFNTDNAPAEIFNGDDLRKNCEEESLGKVAYSIALYSNNCAFTKYVIIRDIGRTSEVGYIAFSLFFTKTEKALIVGSEIKNILDDLLGYYYSEHVHNNNFNAKNEDWTFVTSILSSYSTRFQNVAEYNLETHQHGNREAAYIYYDLHAPLQKYFDWPFQEEYREYKQVFLVQRNFKGEDKNPLNALRHDRNADLTEKVVDLDNTKYTLKNFNGQGKDGVKIELWINDGKPRHNGEPIYKKDTIRIKYSKKYHDDIDKTGSLTDPDVKKYFTIDGSNIRVDTNFDLVKTEKKFTVKVNSKSETQVNADVTCKFKSLTKQIDKNGQITFSGEELMNQWEISAKGQGALATKMFIPEKVDDTEIILLLQEFKEVIFRVQSKGDVLYNFTISLSSKLGTHNVKPGEDKVTFLGDEINEKWGITVKQKAYDDYKGSYCPSSDFSPFLIELVKSPKGNHIENPPPIPKKPPFYQKYKVPIITAAVFLLLGIILFSVKIGSKIEPISDNSHMYVDYPEEIEIFMDTLKKCKRDMCVTKVSNNSEAEQSLLHKIFPFFSSTDKPKPIVKPDKDFCSKIEKAIAIRRAINNGQIDDLRTKKYSPLQQKFKNALDSIKDEYKKQIGDELLVRKVSEMNLDDIADLILKVQRDLELANKPKEPQGNTAEDQSKKAKEISESKKEQKKSNTENSQEKLEKKTEQKTSSLESDFWKLVHSGNIDIKSYKDLYNKHKDEGGEIVAYLKSISNSTSFIKFSNIDEIKRKTAKKLTDITIK